MLRRNTAYLLVILIVLIGAALLLFALEINCTPGSTPPSKVCVGFSLFNKMQTLLTGVLALGAALVAVRPVYLQLERMRIQTDIAARDIIEERTQRIDALARQDHEMVRKVHENFRYKMDHDCTEFETGLSVEWLMERESELREVRRGLLNSNSQRMGTARIESGRDILMFAVADLLQCVGALTAYEDMDRDGGYSDQQIQEAVDKAAKTEPELMPKWLAVNGKLNRFQIDIDFEVDRLRRRIRQIDDSVVEGGV